MKGKGKMGIYLAVLSAVVFATAVQTAILSARLASKNMKREDEEKAHRDREIRRILEREEQQFQALMSYRGGLDGRKE